MSCGEIPLVQASEAPIFLISWALANASGIAKLIVLTRASEMAPLFIGLKDLGLTKTASDPQPADKSSQCFQAWTGQKVCGDSSFSSRSAGITILGGVQNRLIFEQEAQFYRYHNFGEVLREGHSASRECC